jgi:hypothetical protein
MIFGVILFFIGGTIMMMGCLMFINGVFDQSSVQTHQTVIVDKKSVKGRYGRTYYFVVTDWKNPKGVVELDVGLETYKGLGTSSSHQVGEPIRVMTSRGFLGYERFRSVN